MADIAIIGMAARLPGASNVGAFWSNLCAGIDSIRDISEDELHLSGIHPSIWNRENYVRKAAFPDDVEFFDAHFFGLTPGEAAIIDPQHRLLLECAHEALEDAGQDPDRFPGPIAVFAGCALNTYLLTHLMSFPDLLHKIDLVQLNVASSPDFLATRISYKLGLRGVSHTVQCACSTSLVAVHLACQSLLAGESDMALAGGAALNFHLRHGYSHVPGGMFSARGRCRAFDGDADGTVFGNGAGMVVLKRYEDASRDRDQIYAIVKGSAVNNDGAAKVGYTAPSVTGQSLVIAEAMSNAGISPEDVGYVETHGTGTPLGDPIEIEALVRAYQNGTGNGHRCLIGSVKTNIGHLDCAAGVAGLIKTAQILRHGLIPPSLHFVTPNPHIGFDKTPFQVNTELTEWPGTKPRRAASVSAFGVGGTNAHVVLEAASPGRSDRSIEPYHLLLRSAVSEPALDEMVTVTDAHLIAQPSGSLGDAAFTLATGRRQFPWRHAQVITTTAGSGFEVLAAHRSPHVTPATPPPVIFMFPGQGSQTLLMGKELYERESTFRETLDACFALLAQFMDRDPRSLTHLSAATTESERLLHNTEYAQPLLFAFEYALAQLWISWGVNPDLMIGHSLGEYVAACIGGTLSLEDALKLIALRGQLMQTTEPGAMLSVPLGATEAMPFTGDAISLAAVNSPSQCVFSGPEAAIESLHLRLETEGIHARRLAVSRAFHSSLMDPILESFRACLEIISLTPPRVPWMSNLTGAPITAAQAVDPAYWVEQLRNTVRCSDNMRDAHARPNAVFLEMGPQRVLQQLASRLPLSTKNQIAISSNSSEKTEYVSLLSTLGALWVRGIQADWNSVYEKRDGCRVSLPTYPFERQRCWVERPGPAAIAATSTQGLHFETPEIPGNKGSIPITLHNRPRLSTAYLAPSTPTQIRLVSILEPVFGITPLGIRDNFFTLGADSLMAVAVVSQLKEHYAVQLTAVHLYEALDIASLAAIIDEMVAESLQVATVSSALPVVPGSSDMA
jgi:phthiocerol/phenolphthiocerol synthesis type-I polyketide synthase E